MAGRGWGGWGGWAVGGIGACGGRWGAKGERCGGGCDGVWGAGLLCGAAVPFEGASPRLTIVGTVSDTACFRSKLLRCMVLAPAWCAAVSAWGLSPSEVAVVVNDSSPESVEIGRAYSSRRGVECVLHISTEPKETIIRPVYDREIRDSLVEQLREIDEGRRPRCLVTTKGVPLRITDELVRAASVDSELAMIPVILRGGSYPILEQRANPFFISPRVLAERPAPALMVCRLTGYTVADALALVERAESAVGEGLFVVDMTAFRRLAGNVWMAEAVRRLREAGAEVTYNSGPTFILRKESVIGYAGWGSNEASCPERTPLFSWNPGALAAVFVSSTGRTFVEPPADWEVGSWSDDPDSFHAGTPQWLLGDLIREGVSGASGYVFEPYLRHTVHPEELFSAYLDGASLAEAFAVATPVLSWMTVVVGDPLCAPFADGAEEEAPDGGSVGE